LVVRLKLKITVNSKSVIKVSLLNSGYEANSPQLLIPVSVAKELNLWPPEDAIEVEFDTAGGILKAWLYPRKGKVKILTDEEESKEVIVDLVISPLADEPLISDMLAEELEIAVESFGRGLWRFRWEPKEKLRKSEKKET